MTITLPDEMRVEVEALAKERGFKSVDAYVVHLILSNEPDDAEPDIAPGSSEISPRNRTELEAMLDEGMRDTVTVEVDDAFWAERHRVLRERTARTSEAPT